MTSDTLITLELVLLRERQRELWKEADVYRWRLEVRQNAPRLHDHCLHAVGTLLITWGLWMRQCVHPATLAGEDADAATRAGAN